MSANAVTGARSPRWAFGTHSIHWFLWCLFMHLCVMNTPLCSAPEAHGPWVRDMGWGHSWRGRHTLGEKGLWEAELRGHGPWVPLVSPKVHMKQAASISPSVPHYLAHGYLHNSSPPDALTVPHPPAGRCSKLAILPEGDFKPRLAPSHENSQ